MSISFLKLPHLPRYLWVRGFFLWLSSCYSFILLMQWFSFSWCLDQIYWHEYYLKYYLFVFSVSHTPANSVVYTFKHIHSQPCLPPLSGRPVPSYLCLLPRILLMNFSEVNLILTADPQHKGQRNFIKIWLKSFHPSAQNTSNFPFSYTHTHTQIMSLQLPTRLRTQLPSSPLWFDLSPSLPHSAQHFDVCFWSCSSNTLCICIQWNTSWPQKGMKSYYLWQHGWTQRVLNTISQSEKGKYSMI